MNGAEALVATLVDHGVDTAFCVPGESYLAVLEALRGARNRLRLVTNRHEAGAAFAAEAYAKLSGKPGIVFVTRGPGATNAAIGMHTAAQDSTPLVLFIGQVPTVQTGWEAFQEIDYRRMYGAIAKAVVEPTTPAELPAAVAGALSLAVACRPGPVAVVLPEDVTEGEAGEPMIPPPVARPTTPPDAASVEEAARLIRAASRPAVIAGELVAFEGAHAELIAFVEASGAAVFAAFRRQDTFPNDHPAYLGHLGLGRAPFQVEAWQECDLVVAVGARLDGITTEDFTLLRPDQKLIHIHVDPAVLGRCHPADVALAADVGPTLRALKEALKGPPPSERPVWRGKHHRALCAFAEEGGRPHGPVDLAELVKGLKVRLPEDHVLTNDAGNFASWVHRHFLYRRPRSQAGPMAGAMGYAVPAAVGAKLARPEARVIAFVGDGGFLMTGQELMTAVHERLAVTVIVCDNQAYGTILMHQHQRGGKEGWYGTELTSPDFAALGRAFGVPAWSVARTADVAEALDGALAHDGPSLIHVKTDIRDISAFGPLED
ncbi:MAG: thiamine pyrophosphate-dependent enzyme [Alphaproteobacteria bacterium]